MSKATQKSVGFMLVGAAISYLVAGPYFAFAVLVMGIVLSILGYRKVAPISKALLDSSGVAIKHPEPKPWTTKAVVVATVGVIVISVVVKLMPNIIPSRSETLKFYYDTQRLDEMQITRPKGEDMTIRQTKTFVEPNLPDAFTMTGIVPKNDGSTTIQPDNAYLEFEVPIKLWQSNASQWRLSSEQEPGWAVRYDYAFPLTTILAGHPGYVPDFTGTPIPSKVVKVKLVVVYGHGKTSVVFPLAPPKK